MVTWSTTRKDAFVVTCPRGPLGLTIKRFDDEWIVVDSVYGMLDKHPLGRLYPGEIITTIGGKKIESEDDIPEEVEEDTEIGVGERVMSMDAAQHSKGVLLSMKYVGNAMFRTLDYSKVAEKYGEAFLEELSPPQRKTGNQLLAGALSSLSGKNNASTKKKAAPGKSTAKKRTVAKKRTKK